MSVVYLDLGRPEEAIPYLTEALELAKENGLVGPAVAEPTWNLARVYRALGDEEKEDIYLKAAVEASGNATHRNIPSGSQLNRD